MYEKVEGEEVYPRNDQVGEYYKLNEHDIPVYAKISTWGGEKYAKDLEGNEYANTQRYAFDRSGNSFYPRNLTTFEEMYATFKRIPAYRHNQRNAQVYAKDAFGNEKTNGVSYAQNGNSVYYYPRKADGGEFYYRFKKEPEYRIDAKGNEVYARDASGNEITNGTRYARRKHKGYFYPIKADKGQYYAGDGSEQYIKNNSGDEIYAVDAEGSEYWNGIRYARDRHSNEKYPRKLKEEVFYLNYAKDKENEEVYPKRYLE